MDIKLIFLLSLLVTPAWALDEHAAAEDTEAPAEAEAGPEAADVDMVIRSEGGPADTYHGERVDRIFAPNISDFRVVDRQRLILYATRARPYLIVLKRPARGLSYTSVIGLRRRTSSIDARFDSIYVDGFPYMIDYIEQLTPETAKRLLGQERKGRKSAEEEVATEDASDS